MWKALRQATRLQEMDAREIEQNRARQDALKQQTNAGPALRECGKQTLHAGSRLASSMLVDTCQMSKRYKGVLTSHTFEGFPVR